MLFHIGAHDGSDGLVIVERPVLAHLELAFNACNRNLNADDGLEQIVGKIGFEWARHWAAGTSAGRCSCARPGISPEGQVAGLRGRAAAAHECGEVMSACSLSRSVSE